MILLLYLYGFYGTFESFRIIGLILKSLKHR